MSGRRVLVTGAAGYLGREVAASLRRFGAQTFGCDRAGGEGVETSDLEAPGAAQALLARLEPDVVVHAAAIVPVRGDDYHDLAQAELNLRLVDRLIEARPKRVVFISSMTVYGEPCAGPVDEDSATPRSAYAQGKLEGERRLQAAGVDWVAARLPGLFGGRRAGGLVYNLARCALEGREPTLPAEPLVWAAMHVEDAGAAVARLALAEDARGPVNLGYDGALSVNRLLDALAAATGRRFATPVRHPDFEMRLDRAHACGAACPISFEQRLAALVAALRAETVAGDTT